MEDDDDMVIVIVDNEDEKDKDETVIETYEVADEVIVKKEEPTDEFEYEYLEDALFLEAMENIKSEIPETQEKEENSDKEDIFSLEEDTTYSDIDSSSSIEYTPAKPKGNKKLKLMKSKPVGRKKRKIIKPSEYKSFVSELKNENPDLKNDVQLLIDKLVEVMQSIKTPKPPEGYYEKDGDRYRCTFCDISSSTRTFAARHFQDAHGVYYLVCYACGKEFRSTLYLYRHEKRCKAPDAEIVLRARAKSIGSKARGRPFIQPVKPVPKSKPVTIFVCSQCPAKFLRKVALTAHENLHQGRRPYRCTQCPRAYTSSHVLYRHMKLHRNETFICDHCGRTFNTKDILIQHMITHAPVKRFRCEECGQPFAHKAAMIRHINKVHKKLPPPCVCNICNNRYMRMSTLKYHMKRAHDLTLVSRNMFQKALPKMTDTEIMDILKLQ